MSDILEEINKIDPLSVDMTSCNGLCKIVGKEVDEAYLSSIYEQSVNKINDNIKIVYTLLHGSGNKLVRGILDKVGFKNVYIVKEQEFSDGDFPTVVSPNPENTDALDLALSLAKEKNADLIIGTDPDCDKVGVMAREKNGDYIALTGNQVGILLSDYILSPTELEGNEAIVSTIVSTRMIKCKV